MQVNNQLNVTFFSFVVFMQQLGVNFLTGRLVGLVNLLTLCLPSHGLDMGFFEIT